MKRVLTARFVPAVFLFLLPLLLPAETASLRELASLHFGTVDWTGSGKNPPASAIPGVNAPGGNETFPVLSGIRGTPARAISALYPREERLGLLDYSGTDPRLLSLLWSVSESLGALKLDPSLCDPARPFIPVLAEYRLVRLPPVNGVLFSRPQEATPDGRTALFRLMCRKDDAFVPVYLTVSAGPVSSAWKVTEVLFDGESYARIAQPY